MDKLRNIRRHHWKERLKTGKIAKFESNLLKTNEDIAPQRCEILQTFVWGEGRGEAQTSPTIQVFENYHNFTQLYLRSLKTYHFQTWQFY